MSIKRAPRPEANFYVLDKRISEDPRLSWAARGLLVFLLGKPDHWEVSVQHLVNQTKQAAKRTGRDGTYGILKELERAGYLHRSQSREAGAFGQVEYIVTETPLTEKPDTVQPDTDKAYTANPTQVSTEYEQGLKAATTTRTADAERPVVEAEGKPRKLPPCPHQEILALWGEVLPHCRQPAPNLWPGTARADALAARWKACFALNKPNGDPFYTDKESGLDWWRRFFGYIAGNEYLMRGHRWFDLPWVVKRENFVKILERKYEEDVA